MGEGRARIERVQSRESTDTHTRGPGCLNPGRLSPLLSIVAFLLVFLIVLGKGPDNLDRGIALAMVTLLGIIVLWLPFASLRTESPLFALTGPRKTPFVVSWLGILLVMAGLVLAFALNWFWALLALIGLLLWMTPWVARTVLGTGKDAGSLLLLLPLSGPFLWLLPILGLISLFFGLGGLSNDWNHPAWLLLLVVSVLWFAYFLTLVRLPRPDRGISGWAPGLTPLGPTCIAWLLYALVPVFFVLVFLLWGFGSPSRGVDRAISEPAAAPPTTPESNTATTVDSTEIESDPDDIPSAGDPSEGGSSDGGSSDDESDDSESIDSESGGSEDPPPSSSTPPDTSQADPLTNALYIILSDGSQYPVWGLLDESNSVAFVLLSPPRESGCLLISYAGNDVDTFGDCVINQIGTSRPALVLYTGNDGSMLLELRNPATVVLTDEMGFAQSAIVSVKDAPLLPQQQTLEIGGVVYTALTP